MNPYYFSTNYATTCAVKTCFVRLELSWIVTSCISQASNVILLDHAGHHTSPPCSTTPNYQDGYYRIYCFDRLISFTKILCRREKRSYGLMGEHKRQSRQSVNSQEDVHIYLAGGWSRIRPTATSCLVVGDRIVSSFTMSNVPTTSVELEVMSPLSVELQLPQLWPWIPAVNKLHTLQLV